MHVTENPEGNHVSEKLFLNRIHINETKIRSLLKICRKTDFDLHGMWMRSKIEIRDWNKVTDERKDYKGAKKKKTTYEIRSDMQKTNWWFPTKMQSKRTKRWRQ